MLSNIILTRTLFLCETNIKNETYQTAHNIQCYLFNIFVTKDALLISLRKITQDRA